MSAALVLDFSGPPTHCDYPRCTLDAFHDGNHVLPAPKPNKSGAHFYRCTICKRSMVEYGEHVPGGADLCDSKECLLAWCALLDTVAPLLCACQQRPYPHELRVHQQLRSESYNPHNAKLKTRWPWSLALSDRIEFSTERKSEAA